MKWLASARPKSASILSTAMFSDTENVAELGAGGGKKTSVGGEVHPGLILGVAHDETGKAWRGLFGGYFQTLFG